jgi:nicotinamidase-related amidase
MHGIARSDWLAATASLLFLAASTPVPAAQPQSIIDTWRDVTIPPAPELQDIAVDVRHSALIVADMYRTSCIESQRPRCVPTIARVQRLLEEARRHKMTVIHTGSPPTSAAPGQPLPALMPLPGEPTVRAGADKFVHSELEKILADGGITRVIVVGTSADAAVMYTASGAALRGMQAIIPVDAISSVHPFAELYTVWHLKNTAGTVSRNVVLTTTDRISLR